MLKNTIRTSAFVILTMFATNTVFSASSVRQLNIAGPAKTSSATPAVTPARVSTASVIASKAKSATPMITNTTTSAKKTTAARLSTPVNVAKASDSIRLIGTPLATGNSPRNKDKPSSTTSSATLLFNTAKRAQENADAIQEMTDNFAATNQVLVEAINQKAGAESTAAEINSVRSDLTSSINSAINDVRDDMLTSNNLDYELNKSNVLLQMNDNINTKASASEVTGLTQRTVDLESAFSKDGNGDMKVKSDALPVMDMTKVNGLSDFYNAVNDEETGLAAVREKANAAKISADAAQESADAAVKTEELNTKIEEYANSESGILAKKSYVTEVIAGAGIPSNEVISKLTADTAALTDMFEKSESGAMLTKLKSDALPDGTATEGYVNNKMDSLTFTVDDGYVKYSVDNVNYKNLAETSAFGGTPGEDGKSAFELWEADHPGGTLEQFWASLKGANGCETELQTDEIANGFKVTAKKTCDGGETYEQVWSKDVLNGQNGDPGSGGCPVSYEEEHDGCLRLKTVQCDGTATYSTNCLYQTCAPGDITAVNITDSRINYTYCNGTTGGDDLPTGNGDGTCDEGELVGLSRNGNNLQLRYCGEDEPSGTISLPEGGEDCEDLEYGYTVPTQHVPAPDVLNIPSGYTDYVYKVAGAKTLTITDTCTPGATPEVQTFTDPCTFYSSYDDMMAYECPAQGACGTSCNNNVYYQLRTNRPPVHAAQCTSSTYSYQAPSNPVSAAPEVGVPSGYANAVYTTKGVFSETITDTCTPGATPVTLYTEDRCTFYNAALSECMPQGSCGTTSCPNNKYYLLRPGVRCEEYTYEYTQPSGVASLPSSVQLPGNATVAYTQKGTTDKYLTNVCTGNPNHQLVESTADSCMAYEIYVSGTLHKCIKPQTDIPYNDRIYWLWVSSNSGLGVGQAIQIARDAFQNNRLLSSALPEGTLTTDNYANTLNSVYALQSSLLELQTSVNVLTAQISGSGTTPGLAAAVQALVDGGALNIITCSGKPTYSTTQTCPASGKAD